MKKKTKTPTKKPPQITHAEHFRLRPPTDKPTAKDADTCGEVLIVFHDGGMDLCKWYDFEKQEAVGWLPAKYPTHLIPQPETPEAKMRREFEEWAAGNNYGVIRNKEGYTDFSTRCAWESWQAAKGGAQ